MSQYLVQLAAKTARRVVGLMSGTSLDGVDAAVVTISGTGKSLKVQQDAFVSARYDSEIKELLLRNSQVDTSSVAEITRLNVRLAQTYADAVHEASRAARVPIGDIDLIGCHGQTIHHLPDAVGIAGRQVAGTLQIGSAAYLAVATGVPVVSGFREADMALGGQGAPLVPYFDYVRFADANEHRLLVNLGGIANITLLPAGCTTANVVAFDTGPANMVMDALAQRLLNKPYDEHGAVAAEGRINHAVVESLLNDAYFKAAPPKSTGREAYGDAFVDRFLSAVSIDGSPTAADALATAASLTVESVYRGYNDFLAATADVDRIIVAGGGVHNAHLMGALAQRFAPKPVLTTAEHGVDPDAKEAICFAVLAHELLNGVPTNVPGATGASGPTLLGSITMPGPTRPR